MALPRVDDAGPAPAALARAFPLHAVFDAMPAALAVTRRSDGLVLAVNRAWCALLGIAHQAAVGRTSIELGIWRDEADRAQYLEHLQDPTRVLTFSAGLPGQRRVRMHSAPLQVDGEDWLLVHITDAEPEARAQTRLEEQRDLLQRIAARVPGMTYLAWRKPDGSTEFVFISEVAREMMQLAPHEATDDPQALFSRIHADDREAVFNTLDQAGREGRSYRSHYRVCLPDGQVRWHQTDATPTPAPGGGTWWHGFTSDVTEEQQAQAQIEAENATLERRVAERTADLQRTLSDMEAVAYSIAHDLRTPLRSINGFAALVRDEEGAALSSAGRDALERIVQASTRMGRMLSDLLALLEVVRLDLHPSEVDMVALAEDAALALGLRAGGVQLQVDALPGAWGDAPLLRQALHHLLDNAAKFSRQALPPQVRVGYDAAQRAYLVRDNGTGFDPAQATRLFEPFQRLHNDPAQPGLGIGLAIVARIAQRHGGRVWAESTPGAGACFWLRLSERR
jgi:signal transduction histidine kinase